MFNCVLLIASLISCYPSGDGQDTKNPSQDEEETTSSVDLPESLSPGTDVSIGNFDSDVTQQEEDSSPDESPITWTDCDQWPGSHPCDFTLTDQNGDQWSLYENYGKTMVIDFSTMWCAVCKNIAPDVQDIQDKYTNRGYDFLWVTVLIEDAGRDSVEETEIQEWSSYYGMTSSPVLAGSRALIDMNGHSGYPISSWPTLVVIDDEMFLTHGINGWNENTVLGWVDEALGL